MAGMKEKPLLAKGMLNRAMPHEGWREKVLAAMFGEACPYCRKRGIERGYWARGRNHLCSQAAGDWGGYCPHCHKVSFRTTDEEWEAAELEWVSLPGKAWDPDRPPGQQRVKKEELLIRHGAEEQKPASLVLSLCTPGTSQEVYWDVITTHLEPMAKEAGVADQLWRPGQLGVTVAAQLVEPLENGLALLKSDPARFEPFNTTYGFGRYESFVAFVERYLENCKQWPDAKVCADS